MAATANMFHYMSTAEAALDAWASCKPRGYVLPVECLPALLPSIAAHVPGGTDTQEKAQRLHRLFLPAPPELLGPASVSSSSSAEPAADPPAEKQAAGTDEAPPLFLSMLRTEEGQLHFLYFWRAFSQAARNVAGEDEQVKGQGKGYSSRTPSVVNVEGLTGELEILRDAVLACLEATAIPVEEDSSSSAATEASSSTRPNNDQDEGTSSRSPLDPDEAPKPRSPKRSLSKKVLSPAALAFAVQRTAKMSSSPGFWRAVEESLGSLHEWGDQGIEELTVVILSWVHDAIAWEVRQMREDSMAATMSEPLVAKSAFPASQNTDLELVSNASDASVSWAAMAHARLAKRLSSSDTGLQVVLHIYDVSQEESIRKLNKFLAHKFSPVKLGGVFHAGVEVNGLEWSFGSSASETVPGISCVEPRTHPQHQFRQTVKLRRTKRTEEDIAQIISEVIEEYPGDDYDLLRRNCCHFADDFCRRLGVGGIPGWVHRLARIGARVDGVMQLTMNRSLIPAELEDSD